MSSNDKGEIDVYASTMDGEKFSVMSVLAGQKGVVIATDVSYEEAKAFSKAAISEAKAKRAAHILATIPEKIVKIQYEWALEYK